LLPITVWGLTFVNTSAILCCLWAGFGREAIFYQMEVLDEQESMGNGGGSGVSAGGL
jgi:hypothetical protein